MYCNCRWQLSQRHKIVFKIRNLIIRYINVLYKITFSLCELPALETSFVGNKNSRFQQFCLTCGTQHRSQHQTEEPRTSTNSKLQKCYHAASQKARQSVSVIHWILTILLGVDFCNDLIWNSHLALTVTARMSVQSRYTFRLELK